MKEYFRMIILFGMITLFIVGLVGCGGSPNNPTAPNFTLQSLSGENVSLRDFRDKKKVVLIFWDAECRGCVQRMRTMEDLAARNISDLAIVTVCSSTEDKINDFFENNSINHSGYTVLIDVDRKVTIDSYHITSTPNHVFVDRQGNLFQTTENFEGDIVQAYENVVNQMP